MCSHSDEIGFVPSADPSLYTDTTPNQSKPHQDATEGVTSPTQQKKRMFFVVEDKLGISFEAIPPMYKFAWKQFTDLYNKMKQRTRSCNTETQSAGSNTNEEESKTDKAEAELVKRYATVVLIVNADNYTVWNAR